MTGWFPYQVRFEAGQAVVSWLHDPALQFTDSFFSQTIGYSLSKPSVALLVRETDFEPVLALERHPRAQDPAGFIFHVSRCGSTLVSRALAALPCIVSFSEPPALDALLRQGIDRPQALRAMLRAMSVFPARRPIVKFDCWHVLDFQTIREAFPDVPFIFLYRNPLEVLVSLRREPAYWSIPGVLDPASFDLDAAQAASLRGLEYVCRLLQRIYAEGLEITQTKAGLLINYSELPEAIPTKILPFFALSPTSADVAKLHQATILDAKNPYFNFNPDSQRKIQSASQVLVDAADLFLNPHYAALENQRTS